MSDFPMIATERWLNQVFAAKAARNGGVVRRNLRDVEREVGLDWFRHEIRRRGFHAVENAGQIVVFCNNAPVRVLC
ncbi:N-(5'-phosphoribosyl)anthranilate isomerase [Pseudooceanicola sp.]|uniref:N-(5'-phosphoribosyl)anthranilate isomerase n=1 Tax=Pseudooceanicola sp. TaxID=1914328 RepID=UPI002605D707|nr:N-(5'-phosphoribosyl)anthranilate isomerase [Pseudooceanicola sp.]MDF1855496.1 N-(5'-phosphoribosyl)anthranilate isomerase [Pseudooceanicola sp.]